MIFILGIEYILSTAVEGYSKKCSGKRSRDVLGVFILLSAKAVQDIARLGIKFKSIISGSGLLTAGLAL